MPFVFVGVKECALGFHFAIKRGRDNVLYLQYHLTNLIMNQVKLTICAIHFQHLWNWKLMVGSSWMGDLSLCNLIWFVKNSQCICFLLYFGSYALKDSFLHFEFFIYEKNKWRKIFIKYPYKIYFFHIHVMYIKIIQ
jgi:hypothetical protein